MYKGNKSTIFQVWISFVDLLICGVAYHHAGVEMSDRKIIETAFNVGDIPVLCEYKTFQNKDNFNTSFL